MSIRGPSPEIGLQHVTSDYVVYFGDDSDGVIEYVGRPNDKVGVFETGYYYGDAKPKPIIGISPMVGCPAQCNFCELGPAGFGRSLTPEEMHGQVLLMLDFAGRVTDTDRQHKVNVAKSGEPLLNPGLVEGLGLIGLLGYSFKVSTVFPRGPVARRTLEDLAAFAHAYPEPVQLQISLISTSEKYRAATVGKLAASLPEIRTGVEKWREINPAGRKVNLSLILTQETPADPEELAGILPPNLVNVRLRDYIPTQSGANNKLAEVEELHYRDLVARFIDAGYDVSKFARPTDTERRFNLVSNSTLRRYLGQIQPGEGTVQLKLRQT